MKRIGIVLLLAFLAVMVLAVGPVAAQLGDSDVSAINIQNISGGVATVSVSFVADDGTVYTPDYFDVAETLPNPFSLADGASLQIYTPNIPVSNVSSQNLR